jgi:hypothetical protein
VRVHTPDEYNYNQLWVSVESRQWVVFRVMAQNDAHITLSQAAGTPGTVIEKLRKGYSL